MFEDRWFLREPPSYPKCGSRSSIVVLTSSKYFLLGVSFLWDSKAFQEKCLLSLPNAIVQSIRENLDKEFCSINAVGR